MGKIYSERFYDVQDFNRNLTKEFLDNSIELSPATIKTYESSLALWFTWVKEHLNDKKHIEIRPLEYKRYQNWLQEQGYSSSAIWGRRTAISSLNNYIETYHFDTYPTFRGFINRNIKRPPRVYTRDKNPLNKEEFAHLIEVLTELEEWQKVAYLTFVLETGCRRGESIQLLKNVVELQPIVKQNKGKRVTYYETHPIRCKGPGVAGKVRTFIFTQATMDTLRKWIEVRGEDNCEHMFISRYNNKLHKVSSRVFNLWSKMFSKIVGKRVYPHLLRSSRATQLSEEDGVDVKVISKLLGHESVTTTEQHYIIRDDADDLLELCI